MLYSTISIIVTENELVKLHDKISVRLVALMQITILCLVDQNHSFSKAAYTAFLSIWDMKLWQISIVSQDITSFVTRWDDYSICQPKNKAYNMLIYFILFYFLTKKEMFY